MQRKGDGSAWNIQTPEYRMNWLRILIPPGQHQTGVLPHAPAGEHAGARQMQGDT